MSSACVAPTVVDDLRGRGGDRRSRRASPRARARRRGSPAGSPYCSGGLAPCCGPRRASHRGAEHRRVEPLGGQRAEPRHRPLARRPGTCRGSARWRCSAAAASAQRPRRERAAARRRGSRRSRTKKPRCAPRFDEALRLQLVVGGDDRVRAHPVAAARIRAPTAGARPGASRRWRMRSS